MHVPDDELVNEVKLPYTLVDDDIFLLKTWLMKPYLVKYLTVLQWIYNYPTSRARKTVENTFGILSAKWRIYHHPIRASPETVESIIKGTICLHNYLCLTENAHNLPSGFVDCESETGEIVPEDWRKTVQNDDIQGLQHLGHISGNRHCFSADQMLHSSIISIVKQDKSHGKHNIHKKHKNNVKLFLI